MPLTTLFILHILPITLATHYSSLLSSCSFNILSLIRQLRSFTYTYTATTVNLSHSDQYKLDRSSHPHPGPTFSGQQNYSSVRSLVQNLKADTKQSIVFSPIICHKIQPSLVNRQIIQTKTMLYGEPETADQYN